MYEVSGRQFRTETDYKLAKRDALIIEKIRKQYDFQKIEDVRAAALEVKSGKYRFYTILEQDFLDELSELQKEKQKNMAENYEAGVKRLVKKELKKRDRIRKGIIFASLFVAAVCFLYLGSYYYQVKRLDNYTSKQQEMKGLTVTGEEKVEAPVIHYNNEEIIPPDILPEYQALFRSNSDIIGWIKIADTYIDYPVLQTDNNEYYLKHNFDHEEDKNGSIFLDKDCMIYPRSTNLILYGHHMQSGRMFGQLSQYNSETFYAKHKTFEFDTIYEKGTYEVMYVFRSQIYEESDVRFKYYQFINADSEAEFNSYMKEMAQMSLYDTGVTANYGDELLTLSTCDYYTNYGRFVVVARKVN
ncbi:MAG: class B sortase [Lachnospiraceae bacterium]